MLPSTSAKQTQKAACAKRLRTPRNQRCPRKSHWTAECRSTRFLSPRPSLAAITGAGAPRWRPTNSTNVSPPLAVEAGIVAYDPNQEAACLQALRAQNCHGDDLWYNIPHCVGSFVCVADAGGGDSSFTDSAQPDGGASCPDFLLGAPSLPTCATNSDCTSDASPPAGPYCVDGYCYSTSCGDLWGAKAECPPFVNSGQPCDSDPPKLGNLVQSTPSGPTATNTCAPGLTCRGASTDGGLGKCAIPQEIGAPCSEGAHISGCAVGLVCQCGACRIPPRQGPCVAGNCELGVAYCDFRVNTCLPVHAIGGDLHGGHPGVCSEPEVRHHDKHVSAPHVVMVGRIS